jgi:hypothetical protein
LCAESLLWRDNSSRIVAITPGSRFEDERAHKTPGYVRYREQEDR